jgi:hypothetical protein
VAGGPGFVSPRGPVATGTSLRATFAHLAAKRDEGLPVPTVSFAPGASAGYTPRAPAAAADGAGPGGFALAQPDNSLLRLAGETQESLLQRELELVDDMTARLALPHRDEGGRGLAGILARGQP